MPKLTRDDKTKVELTVSSKTIVRLVLVALVLYVVFKSVHIASHSLLLIFIAFFLALALNAPVQFITKHLPGKLRGSRGFGTMVSGLIVLLILGGMIAYVGPPLVRQTQNFVSAAPHLVSEFRNQNGAVGKFIRHYHLESQVNTFANQLSKRLHNIGGHAVSELVGIGKSVFSLVAVIVLTIMMLMEGPRWVDMANRLIPNKHQGMADRLAKDMYGVIRGYVNGQVILAAIASVFITPALYVLGISYPVALIVVIFVCGLIPLVGHTIGAVIVTVVALFHSFSSGLIILIYYLLYQQIENYLIQPKLQANTTKTSPLLVFAALIIGINFGGLIGGLVAIPVAGCLRILVLEVLRTRNLISTRQFDQATSLKSDRPSATEDR